MPRRPNLNRLAALQLRRIPMPLLVGAVMLSIGASIVTGMNLVRPEVRFSFYVVAGLTSGMWLLARRSIRSATVRLLVAAVADFSAISIARRSIEDPLGPVLPLAVTVLLLGVIGWFSFLRHVEDEARRAGGWRSLART